MKSGMTACAHGVTMRAAVSAKKAPSEPVQRIALAGALGEQSAQRACFLRGHAHSLAPDRVEPAHGVAEQQEAGRERLEPLVVAVNALRKTVADDVAQALGGSNRVVDRRRSKA